MAFGPGRSPRARRSPTGATTATAGRGSISASAEEPWKGCCSRCASWVDLRERGGAVRLFLVHRHGPGRSPRARRSQEQFARGRLAHGSISASAEEPRTTTRPRNCARVDLRERGGAFHRSRTVPTGPGRSPRARRSPRDAPPERVDGGSISASAEEPRTPGTARRRWRVDLRERGGAVVERATHVVALGRSPRARRSRSRRDASKSARGSISASAEEPIRTSSSRRSPRVDLRERGGAAIHVIHPLRNRGRSPRARRSLGDHERDLLRVGWISASAEEPNGSTTRTRCGRVDLRERGGASVGVSVSLAVLGLSLIHI